MVQVLLVAWAINAIALALTALLLPGVKVDDAVTLVVAAAVVGLVNALIRPVVSLLTLPLTVMTLGLFAVVVNALMIGLAAWIVPGFDIDGFVPAIVGAIVLGILSTVIAFIAYSILRPQASGLAARTPRLRDESYSLIIPPLNRAAAAPP
jgi:putative membrane protein